MTPTASSPRLLSSASSMRGPAGDQRDLRLEAEVGVGAHELHRVRAGKAVEHAVDVADLGDEGRVVRRHQRRPQLLDDLAAGVLEDALEGRHLLVAEGEVLGDGGHPLQAHLLGGVVAHDVRALPGAWPTAGSTQGLTLRCVTSSAAARLISGVWRCAHVVGDGEELEGGERPEDDVDLVALDAPPAPWSWRRPGCRRCRPTSSSTLRPAKVPFFSFRKVDNALLHLDAALRQRPGLDGQEADLERRALSARDRRHGDRRGRRQHSLKNGSASDAHRTLPPENCPALGGAGSVAGNSSAAGSRATAGRTRGPGQSAAS